jgi:hypothetical protein
MNIFFKYKINLVIYQLISKKDIKKVANLIKLKYIP